MPKSERGHVLVQTTSKSISCIINEPPQSLSEKPTSLSSLFHVNLIPKLLLPLTYRIILLASL